MFQTVGVFKQVLKVIIILISGSAKQQLCPIILVIRQHWLRPGVHKPFNFISEPLNVRAVCEYLVLTTYGNTTFDPNGTTTAIPTDSDGLTETEKILIGVLVPVRKDFIVLSSYYYHNNVTWSLLKTKSVLLLCGIIFGALVGTKSWKKREIVPETPADELSLSNNNL